MEKPLRDRMYALVEGSADMRTNARTTLYVASQGLAKEAATLKAASKSFATVISQLPSLLKYAHAMTEAELKQLKKLLDRLDETKDKLKKYTVWADENADDAAKLASQLQKPGPSTRPGPEPDPDKPFGQPWRG